MISKDDYIAWKNQDATKQMFEELATLSRSKIAEIVNRVRPDVEWDQYLKGYIAGLDEAVAWKPEFAPENEEEEDE